MKAISRKPVAYELVPVHGERRFGYRDKFTVTPLAVDVLPARGDRTAQRSRRAAKLQVRWRVLQVPTGAEERLFPGNVSSIVTDVVGGGRTYLPLRLGKKYGVYLVSAELMDSPGSTIAYFHAYTESVTFELHLDPIKPAIVGSALRITLHAHDWRGQPVANARIRGAFADTDDDVQGRGTRDIRATGGARGRFVLSLKSSIAGRREIGIGDGVTGYSIATTAELLPGSVNRLVLSKPPAPIAAGQLARISLSAVDRFGNPIVAPKVGWRATRGRPMPVEARAGESAAALIVTDKRVNRITACVGAKSASVSIRGYETALLGRQCDAVTFVGETFRFGVMAVPPVSGVLEGFRLVIKEPRRGAERVDFCAVGGIGMPRLSEIKGGRIELALDRVEVPVHGGTPIFLGELTYACTEPEEVCFGVESASLTIATSPGEKYELNPGVDFCRPQKERATKTLCLHFCIAAAPKANKTPEEVFNAIKAEVEAQVAQTNTLLSENVPVCCPIITIVARYGSIPWADYQAIVAGGAKPGSMEVLPGPWGDAGNTNAAKDTFTPNDKLKALIRLCRHKNCISVYYVPKIQLQKDGVWKKVDGAAISPRDFPETTGADGSGPSIVLHQGLAANQNQLIHELGHMLIDLPRDVSDGIEHVGDAAGVGDRIMKTKPPHGRKFTQEECSRIFDSIGRYGGS